MSFDLCEMNMVLIVVEETGRCWWKQATFPCCKVAVSVGLPDRSITGVGERSWGRGAAKRGRRLRQSSARVPCGHIVLLSGSFGACSCKGCGISLVGIGSNLSVLP